METVGGDGMMLKEKQLSLNNLKIKQWLIS